jgi:serine/threonine protein kinase
LGDLKELVAGRSRLESIHDDAPSELKDIRLNGLVAADPFGSLTLGTFNSPLPNVTVKTFYLDSRDFKTVKHDIVTSVDAARTVMEHRTATDAYESSFLPKLLASFGERSSFHLIFAASVVCSLESWAQSQHSTPSPLHKESLTQGLPYVTSCVVSAIESLHLAGVIYRSVQPECVHLDALGRVVLLDYGVSKVGCVGGKTFTLCGAHDYLSPEQLAQGGHNEAVDFWQLGLFLFELLAGENPFSAENSNELAVMRKITQFGQLSFSQLTFPEFFPPPLVKLINSLVVPRPEERLGVAEGGLECLKLHEYFAKTPWGDLPRLASPLSAYCEELQRESLSADEGIPAEIVEKWNGSDQSQPSAAWLEEILSELE